MNFNSLELKSIINKGAKLMKKLAYFRYFIKNSWFVLMWRLFKKKKNTNKFLGKKNITLEYSNNVLKKWIESGKPFSAIRFGAVELSCINNYEKICLGFKKNYKPSVRYSIKNGAGVFPVSKDNLTLYSQKALMAFSSSTILGISGIHMEDYFYKKYCSSLVVLQYEAFEPLRGDWIQSLKHKKVLVISPFAEDIEKQYKIKDKLFYDNIVPDFKLLTLEAVQTIADQEDNRFNSFDEALEYMKKQIDEIDFDIALVGAGAYGSLLCAHIAKIGKQAIQTGGATQTMFGIIGKRWEKREHVAKYINEYWIRPTNKPKGYQKVEKGCYW